MDIGWVATETHSTLLDFLDLLVLWAMLRQVLFGSTWRLQYPMKELPMADRGRCGSWRGI
jgi:hypothetical protein